MEIFNEMHKREFTGWEKLVDFINAELFGFAGITVRIK